MRSIRASAATSGAGESCLFVSLKRRAQRIRAAWLSAYRPAHGHALASPAAQRPFLAIQVAPGLLRKLRGLAQFAAQNATPAGDCPPGPAP